MDYKNARRMNYAVHTLHNQVRTEKKDPLCDVENPIAELELIREKKSTLSAVQRNLIVSRYGNS